LEAGLIWRLKKEIVKPLAGDREEAAVRRECP